MAGKRRAGWRPCPPGEWTHLAQDLRQRRQRRRFLRGAAGLAAAAASGGVLVWWMAERASPTPSPGDPSYAGIACSQVKARAEAYAQGSLGAAEREQIRQHLSLCASCKAFYAARGAAARRPATPPQPA